MGLLANFKESQKVGLKTPRALELQKYIKEIEVQTKLDWTRRVYGDGVYSGYKTLRDFYKGKQWSFKKEGGGTMRTYNYVFTIVENMTAFLTNEPPQISCPPNDPSNALDRIVAEGRTKLLDSIHEENMISLVFQRAVRTGSITGDAFLFGAIPTFKVNPDTLESELENIRYWNIEKPETIRVIWKDENFSEIGGFIKHYRISVAQAKKLFAKEIKETELQVTADFDTDNPEQAPTEIPMITIDEYWDERDYVLMFNNSQKVVSHIEHNWGFIPLHYVPNIHLPGEPKGTSDIEHELDPQQEYNERASDVADIIKEMARPTYWGKNLDNLTEVRSGQTVIYQVGDDGDIQAMPRSGTTAPLETYLQDRKNDMIGLSGLNQVLYPGSQVLQATGRALSVVMQGVNNKISLRKEWWEVAFKHLNKTILFHAENHIPQARLLISGNYRTDVFISSVLLRSVSDEISKFQAKVQSLTTTQQNVGINNPSEEQKLMKEELQDEVLSVEISKQPGLLHQIIAQRMADAQQANGGVGGGAGVGKVAGQPPRTQNPDSVTEGGVPPQAGVSSPVSPAGAIAGNAARSGGVPVAPKR